MTKLRKHHAQVPGGIAIAIPVLTMAFPLLGTIEDSEAYKSYPAANALPLVGTIAFCESFLICNGTDLLSASSCVAFSSVAG